MIQHFLNSPTALGTFTATMSVVACTLLAFGNRRYYVSAPRSVALGYRAAWLTTAAAWFASGVQTVLGANDHIDPLVISAALIAAVLVASYFTIQMRRYAGSGR